MSKLILGGARSGKTKLAETLAGCYTKVNYVATAFAIDDETAKRIEKHKSERPNHWQTTEAPIKLAQALKANDQAGQCLVIDCLSFWVNNCLYDSYDTWVKEKTALLETLNQLDSELIFVSNESGLGVIPLGSETRRFIDELGWLHQALAKELDTVVLVVAGLPNVLKGSIDSGE